MKDGGQKLYTPEVFRLERNGVYLFIDPLSPNWVSTNKVGSEIVGFCKGRTLEEIAERISTKWGIDLEEALKDSEKFIKSLREAQFISSTLYPVPDYQGRASAIECNELRELWIHTNNTCNLRCRHCLVSAGEVSFDVMDTKEIKKVIDEAISLGVNRFYFTGGEPFLRKDIFDLIDYITRVKDKELVILSNGTLLDKKRIEKLKELKSDKLTLQISLDGPNAEINDALRGKGSFEKAVKGIRNLISVGITPIVTTTLTKINVDHAVKTSEFIASLGVKDHHILWLHPEGRTEKEQENILISAKKMTETMRALREEARELGIVVDNDESLRVRVKGKRGRKNDLCNATYEMICVNCDGNVYPCAPLVGNDEFICGSVKETSLKDIWLSSPIMKEIRESSVRDKEGCIGCYLRFICGGGCLCQSYLSRKIREGKGNLMALDPYCGVYKALMLDLLWESAVPPEYKVTGNGYSSPMVLASMPSSLPSCVIPGIKSKNPDIDVGGYHCSCVLAVDVEEDREQVCGVCEEELVEASTHGQEGAKESEITMEASHSCCPSEGEEKIEKKEVEEEASEHAPCCPSDEGAKDVKEAVKATYTKASREFQAEIAPPGDYDVEELKDLPTDVIGVSYGCGNPVAIGELKEGERVLDIGAGGGIDCFLAAKKVGEKGTVIGIDMTEDMLLKSMKNAFKMGARNVFFKYGEAENIPVPDESVDVVMSNCVINMAPDKAKVYKEINRVLKARGRITISDIVSDKNVPDDMKKDKELWTGCISGAMLEKDYLKTIGEAGFKDLEIVKRYLWKEIGGIGFHSITLKAFKR